MKRQVLSLILLLFCFAFASAQNSLVRGKVIESVTGKAAIAATIKVTGNVNLTVVSDLDGAFSFSVPAGMYQLDISLIGFETSTVKDISINEKVVVLQDIILQPTQTQMSEVVISSKRVQRSTEEAMSILRRKSPVILDGISAAKMKLIGDATAGEAAKRVTGVSIEGGKYVFIRGLGDRYSKTILNGLDIPGLDPDRNSLQLDIFPSALIDNIFVSKNFLPHMPADFTGGLMNIETIDFPTKRIFNVSFSTSFNPDMHFNDSFLKGNRGGLDWLGMDDGTRKLPDIARTSNKIPTPISGATPAAVTDFVNSFNSTLGATPSRSFADYSFGVSVGDQINLKKSGNAKSSPKLGYVAALSYRFDQKLYDNVQYGEYQKNIDKNANELVSANTLDGNLSEESILFGALAGLAYKTDYSKIKFNVIRLQSGENRAARLNIFNNSDAVGQSGYIASSDNIEYGQRSVTNLQLNSSHVLVKSGWKIDWAVGHTISSATDPDIRKTAFTLDPGRTYFNPGAGGNPTRIWRYLDEKNLSFRLDLEKKIGKKNLLKFGAMNLTKDRDYEIRFYNIQFFGAQQLNWIPDANSVLIGQNIYPSSQNNIYYVSGNSDPNSNQYTSRISNFSGYISDDIDITNDLKAVLGIRAEKYTQFHTGRDQRYAAGDVISGKNLDNEKVLDQLDLFPSMNLIQKFGNKNNLRVSYTRTTARPSFKELSFAQIVDPLTNRIFNGSLFRYDDWNGNLVPTMIDNYDFRWEKYFKGAEIISLSLFYKRFQDPIELVRIPQQQTSTEYQPRNVGTGTLFGLEFEFNKSLDFISEKLDRFNFSSNITMVESSITMSDLEYNARKAYEKPGEGLKRKRGMAGQSPYVINAGLTYANSSKGINMGMFYNVKGATISIVGSGLFPDVYALPYNNLSFSFNKAVSKDKKWTLSLRADNILNDDIQFVFRGYGAQDQIFSDLDPRRSFSVGFSYKY
jgi:TonB-dependent receptor